MKVIGAGLGRTGTTSLKLALNQLGFAPCYHMEELLTHPGHATAWLEASRGRPVDWDALLAGFSSGVDFPVQHHYRALLERWPDAKVILTVRDPTRWYQSTLETIYAISKDVPIRWIGPYLPVFGSISRLAVEVIWEGMFSGRFLDQRHAIEVFRAYNESVRATVPSERLLIFEVREGWGPLCAFLDVPVPETAFPHQNDLAVFQRRVRRVKAACWTILLLPPLAVLGAFIARSIL